MGNCRMRLDVALLILQDSLQLLYFGSELISGLEGVRGNQLVA
jgi:hypothetical protein